MEIEPVLIQPKTTKTELSNYYQVDRATFSKWLNLFCDDLFSNKEILLNRRKFTALEVEQIKSRLGKKSQSFRKYELVELAETTYQTIRDNIEKYPSTYGISLNTYNQLSKFPPKIAFRIIDGLC